MQIYLLKRIEKAAPDEAQAMVVIANNEDHARRMSSSNRHSLQSDGQGYGDEGPTPWKDAEKVLCYFLGEAETQIHRLPGIVLTSFHHA